MDTKYYCPECKTELMEHDATDCLNRWVPHALGWDHSHGIIYRGFNNEWQMLPPFAFDTAAAYRLMEWVWERDKGAIVTKDAIVVIDGLGRHSSKHRQIPGPTFPLRVCRAALWLALSSKEPHQDATIAPENDS